MDPSFQAGLAWLVGILGSLAALFSVVKRRPPLSEELYRSYMTRCEHVEECAKMSVWIRSVEKKTDDTKNEIKNQLTEISTAVGRIEGELQVRRERA